MRNLFLDKRAVVAIAVIALVVTCGCVKNFNVSSKAFSPEASYLKDSSVQEEATDGQEKSSSEQVAYSEGQEETTDGEDVSTETEKDVSSVLPFVGLSEDRIADTWLGEPFKVVVLHEGEKKAGKSIEANCYQWASKNGKDDIIFYAYCNDGEVTQVKKGMFSTDYWPTYFGLPDLYATGDVKPKVSNAPDYDPYDFSSPEEYADNAEQWFADQGYDDPWDAAYLYWEGNM